jgi:hypothetical protein
MPNQRLAQRERLAQQRRPEQQAQKRLAWQQP